MAAEAPITLAQHFLDSFPVGADPLIDAAKAALANRRDPVFALFLADHALPPDEEFVEEEQEQETLCEQERLNRAEQAKFGRKVHLLRLVDFPDVFLSVIACYRTVHARQDGHPAPERDSGGGDPDGWVGCPFHGWLTENVEFLRDAWPIYYNRDTGLGRYPPADIIRETAGPLCCLRVFIRHVAGGLASFTVPSLVHIPM